VHICMISYLFVFIGMRLEDCWSGILFFVIQYLIGETRIDEVVQPMTRALPR
jgi:hypothetical protein